MKKFGVIVIGAGHAGAEAAAAAARQGVEVLLLTKSLSNIGEMSCNPAIGGIAKGTIVREIDALDGVMGRAIDMAGIHYKMLNQSKGPAVWGPRAQADRELYKIAMQKILAEFTTLSIKFESVIDLLIEDNIIKGVLTDKGNEYLADAVILTTGTFLNGVIHIGTQQTKAGRVGEEPSYGISERLAKFNFNLGRLKTGTPARLHSDSINWDILDKQEGDAEPQPFSYLVDKITIPQITCFITKTNADTHEIIRNNVHFSPMYSGQIKSLGPRYCPSIEDKIMRFADKTSHQIFLEPEGLNDKTVYPNGISTSLPEEVQIALIRSIRGLENVEILRLGYAIEYDYVDPRELYSTLETRKIKNLFFAGQINGTTGYEEAAGQGLIAGINAGLIAKNDDRKFTLDRSEAYIGVMIDDLINLGTSEPYRMFTSRSEYRLTMRQDNADQRLTLKAIEFDLASKKRIEVYSTKIKLLSASKQMMVDFNITPNEAANYNIKLNQDGKRRTALDLLAIANVNFDKLIEIWNQINDFDEAIKKQIAIEAIYDVYVKRQKADIVSFKKDEAIKIPAQFDYFSPKISLSTELRGKLDKARPETIGAASRMPGITPAALAAIYIALKNKIFYAHASEA